MKGVAPKIIPWDDALLLIRCSCDYQVTIGQEAEVFVGEKSGEEFGREDEVDDREWRGVWTCTSIVRVCPVVLESCL